MVALDYAALDGRIAAMAAALRRRRYALDARTFVHDDDVAFVREASSVATVRALGELGSDPFTAGIRAWVGHLAIERVTSADVVRAATARHEPLAPTPSDPSTDSVAELARLLVAGSDRDARRAAERLASVQPAADAMRRLAERRAEAMRLLQASTEPKVGSQGPSEVEATADRVFELTQQAFEVTSPRGDWVDLVRGAVGRDAGEGWPARMTHRWFLDLFANGELFRGVVLEPVRLPEPAGAASFARALARVGEAWVWADRPSSSPLSMVRAPDDPLAHRRAALLAMLPLETKFHERKLGLGRDRARKQVREIGRAALVWLRVAALRALAWPLLLTPAGPRDFEDLCERALGRAMRGSLLGVVPRLSSNDGPVLTSILEALADRERLRDEYDEDWFDNPRSHEALRHEHHVLVSARDTVPSSERNTAALSKRITELFAAE